MTLLPISCKIFIDLEILSEKLLLMFANRFEVVVLVIDDNDAL